LLEENIYTSKSKDSKHTHIERTNQKTKEKTKEIPSTKHEIKASQIKPADQSVSFF
jgi:hypothetical protein